MILGRYKNALFIAWELVEISKSHFWNFENFTWKNRFFSWKYYTFLIFWKSKFSKYFFSKMVQQLSFMFGWLEIWSSDPTKMHFLAPARLWKFQKSIFWNFEISLFFFKNRDGKMSLEISRKKIQTFRDVFL